MNTYRKLFAYIPQFKSLAILAVIISGASCILITGGYYTIYRFLNALIVSSNLQSAQSFAFVIMLLLLAGSIFRGISGLIAHNVGFNLETALRKRGVEGLNTASFRFFDTHSSGSIRKTIDDNAALTHTIVAHIIPDGTRAFLMPIFIIVVSFFVNIRVGLCVTILTLVTGAILASMMGGNQFMKVYQDALDKLSAETVEYIRGIAVIKIFGVSISSMKKLFTLIQTYSDYAYQYSKHCKKSYVLYQFLFFGVAAILVIPIVFFLPELGSPSMLALDLMMVLFLSGVMFSAFMNVMYLGMFAFQGNYAVDSLEALYKQMADESMHFGSETHFAHHSIEFKDVSFSYGDKHVLQNLSFTLEENKIYALVGESGSGKSTIAKLICAYYPLDSGAVLIGGKPLSSYTQGALIREISFVFQDAKLFNDTLFNNVHCAKRDASHEEVMAAMSAAGLDSVINKLENRENTLIGTKGVYLSGGETQRVAIARAILKNAPIVIMDEASASVDADNEYELQKAFKQLMRGKTVIMIAHRLSSITGVDEILLAEQGKIVERGSHAQLIAQNGKYKRLYTLYTQANEWRVSNE
ncbi:ABC transporter, ATP-binding protein [Fannyhessea vaginae PB189-T1-4]|uniref:ABC transporter, ATP-binding protein n=1 Tax=Fannyhessea vaginae PB189-T1-4 TaxID=866774 RepID=A0ABN0B0R9_9ACTN|nr:ABC transporter ATP-binding protein [Fannyhessea vaginae]EFL44390.1 ABC transporter, ATP-binding protein [Fannyhessea vaginae PB189-T1-4]